MAPGFVPTLRAAFQGCPLETSLSHLILTCDSSSSWGSALDPETQLGIYFRITDRRPQLDLCRAPVLSGFPSPPRSWPLVPYRRTEWDTVLSSELTVRRSVSQSLLCKMDPQRVSVQPLIVGFLGGKARSHSLLGKVIRRAYLLFEIRCVGIHRDGKTVFMNDCKPRCFVVGSI